LRRVHRFVCILTPLGSALSHCENVLLDLWTSNGKSLHITLLTFNEPLTRTDIAYGSVTEFKSWPNFQNAVRQISYDRSQLAKLNTLYNSLPRKSHETFSKTFIILQIRSFNVISSTRLNFSFYANSIINIQNSVILRYFSLNRKIKCNVTLFQSGLHVFNLHLFA